MRKMIKRTFIFALLSILVFSGVKALETNDPATYDASLENFDFIEDMKLDSSRYSRVEDLSIIDTELYIPINAEDVLVTSNGKFELYFNEDELAFKVKNKVTNYVWSSIIEDAEAGTFTELLESSIGFEYINVTKSMAVTENIGITNTIYTVEITEITDGILLEFDVGAICSKRICERFYPDYLNGEYTKEEMIENGLTELNIAFSLEVTLNEEGLNAKVPVDSIVENNSEEVLLSSFIIFPGLGATHMDDIPGYMILPEGSGALIRYEDNEEKYITPFIERYYGINYGLYEQRDSVLYYPLSMPIFGAVHGVNQNAVLGIIEGGMYNSRLVAFPNGALNIEYNLIYTKIDYRQVYRQPFTSDGSQGTMRQLQTTYEDVIVQYNFLSLDDANYTGVGSNYRDYLTENGSLTQKEAEANIPIKIEYFMSDTEQTFLGSAVVEASTVADVKEMYDYFMNNGVENQEVVLTGWNDGGASGVYPTDLDFENKLGSNASYRDLLEHIMTDNDLVLSNNFVLTSESRRGINYRLDVAAGTNRIKLIDQCPPCVNGDYYVLYPSTSLELATKYHDEFEDAGVKVLVGAVSSILFSYYQSGQYLRQDTLEYYEDIMEQYDGMGTYYYPYNYAYEYTDSFYDAPLYNSQLKYYDDLIPLVEIVLHGSLDLYSPDLNFNSLGQEQILALVDFGVYPSFTLTKEVSSTLKDTDSRHLYTSEFDLWKDTVTNTYSYVNEALKHVEGQYITARTVLENGIVKVSYSNDVIIYVNYTTEQYNGEVVIAPMDYYVGGAN